MFSLFENTMFASERDLVRKERDGCDLFRERVIRF